MSKRFYGWRPSPPDQRDRLYNVAPAVLAALPPKVDLSVPSLPAPFEPALNQRSLGSCGPHSQAVDIIFSMLRQGAPSPKLPSVLFSYYCTRLLMGTVGSDSGVDNRSMLKALAQFGWCDDELWPYVIDRFREKPPQVCFEQAARRKAIEYLAVPQTLEQMRGCLASGDPFIFGFSVYESFERASVEATGIVPMPSPLERLVGGHDVLMVGYDDATQRFKFKNSYGPGWGQNGYGFIPYAFAASPRLAADFWTVRHVPVESAPPPVPVSATHTLTFSGSFTLDGKVYG